MKKTINEKLQEANFEIEELAMQLADMLGAALHYAGVPDEKMKDAVEAYLDALDEIFKNEMEEEMGYEEIVQTIDYLKKTKPYLFKK